MKIKTEYLIILAVIFLSSCLTFDNNTNGIDSNYAYDDISINGSIRIVEMIDDVSAKCRVSLTINFNDRDTSAQIFKNSNIIVDGKVVNYDPVAEAWGINYAYFANDELVLPSDREVIFSIENSYFKEPLVAKVKLKPFAGEFVIFEEVELPNKRENLTVDYQGYDNLENHYFYGFLYGTTGYDTREDLWFEVEDLPIDINMVNEDGSINEVFSLWIQYQKDYSFLNASFEHHSSVTVISSSEVITNDLSLISD